MNIPVLFKLAVGMHIHLNVIFGTFLVETALADPADRFFLCVCVCVLWGGASFGRGGLTYPFSSFSTDLGHFISKLLNFDIYFLFYIKFLSLFSLFCGGKQATLGHLGGMALSAPPPPWISQWETRTYTRLKKNVYLRFSSQNDSNRHRHVTNGLWDTNFIKILPRDSHG